MTYMGKESKAVDICITDSLCCTAETNTTLYTNYTPIKILNKCLAETLCGVQVSCVLAALDSA